MFSALDNRTGRDKHIVQFVVGTHVLNSDWEYSHTVNKIRCNLIMSKTELFGN